MTLRESNLFPAFITANKAAFVGGGAETAGVIATAAGTATTFCDDDEDDDDEDDDEEDDDDVPVKSRYADPDPSCRTGAL